MEESLFKDLIGIPFKNEGRGPDGYDCWGLCVEVFRRFGIILPDFNISALACIEVSRTIRHETKRSSSWRKLDKPCTPSIVVMSHHVGVMVEKTRFLHVRVDMPVCSEKISSILWKDKIIGYYEYVS